MDKTDDCSPLQASQFCCLDMATCLQGRDQSFFVQALVAADNVTDYSANYPGIFTSPTGKYR
jgi:hypothetical protein